jgi:hypothetical protein
MTENFPGLTRTVHEGKNRVDCNTPTANERLLIQGLSVAQNVAMREHRFLKEEREENQRNLLAVGRMLEQGDVGKARSFIDSLIS